MLFTFIFVTLIGWLINKHLDKLRLGLSAVFLFILNFLFVVKYFYYREFHTNFNETIFNDVKVFLYNDGVVSFIRGHSNIYGDGITKNILSDEVAGGHINIGATIFELIVPQGFEYYSLGKSLTREANDSV